MSVYTRKALPPSFCPHSKVLEDGKEHSAEVVEEILGGVFDVTVSPLRDQSGHLVGAVHVAHDITQVKRASEQRLESERLYRQLVENASDIIYQTDGNGFFKVVNPVALRITGYTEEEVIGKSFLELVHPDHRESTNRFYGYNS